MSLRSHRAIAPISVAFAAGLLVCVGAASKASGAAQWPAYAASTSVVAAHQRHIVDDEGDVQLRVPGVVIAATDGLPATLLVGTTYVLELHIWVAGGEAPMVATVDVSHSATTACGSSTLPAATISTIRCRVRPLGSGDETIVVRARVGPQQAPVATANFTHDVARPMAAS